jgi:hypothetical protein
MKDRSTFHVHPAVVSVCQKEHTCVSYAPDSQVIMEPMLLVITAMTADNYARIGEGATF